MHTCTRRAVFRGIETSPRERNHKTLRERIHEDGSACVPSESSCVFAAVHATRAIGRVTSRSKVLRHPRGERETRARTRGEKSFSWKRAAPC